MIKTGEIYIFTKSGSEVKVIEPTTVSHNGKKLKGFVVARTDSGKRMFVPGDALKTKQSLDI